VVLSHLRWDGVWQRPHHLISRFAPVARRTWFVEEPVPRPISAPRLRLDHYGPVTRVVPELPVSELQRTHREWFTFGDEPEADLLALLGDAGEGSGPLVWMYTPLALPLARRLMPRLLVYDVMDDLSSFHGAADAMSLRQMQALAEADVVFTGGRSLHEFALAHRRWGTTACFPSGVDLAHFRRARDLRVPRQRPVAGYLGVIDERIDLVLVDQLATLLPQWEIRMVGPVTKIAEADLPRGGNISWQGQRPYAELPRILAGWDVALMPFALNQATRSISPTKTPEYLAAGLDVVSTAVPDVVRDYGGIVHVAADAHAFATACEGILRGRPSRTAEIDRMLEGRGWDRIAAGMAAVIRDEEAGGGDIAVESV
jgi:hypothetical protein